MTGPRGILAAGAVAAVISVGHAGYCAWPALRGTEVSVPAVLERLGPGSEWMRVRLRYERIALDVPHLPPAVTGPYEPLRRSGDWWTAGANARRLRGRPLYVQLTPDAVAIGDAPAAGAINLAGTVVFVREDGYLRLDFSIAPIAVAATVRDGPATAVLRVLPSGRATLTGVRFPS